MIRVGGGVPIWLFFNCFCPCATSPVRCGPGPFFVEGARCGGCWVSVAVVGGVGWVDGYVSLVLVLVVVECGLVSFVFVVPP